jgi:uncharacterized membrane protein YdbT with pleckstrin-like domain
MGYVDENLIQGEQVTYRVSLHWKVLAGPFLAAAILLAISAFAFREAWIAEQASRVFAIAGGVLLFLSLLFFLQAVVRVRSAEFAVTNRRVILKTGFIKKKTAEMFLAKIESVAVDQTIPGRVFGYGTIVIRGTGGSLEPFPDISAPLEFRRQIQEQIGQSLERRQEAR